MVRRSCEPNASFQNRTLKPHFQCVVLQVRICGRWLDHDYEALINEICALVKGMPNSPVICPFFHEKTAICEPSSGSSLDPESASTLILVFPAPRTVRNTFLSFNLPSL